MLRKTSLLSFQKTKLQINQTLRLAVLFTAGLRIAICCFFWLPQLRHCAGSPLVTFEFGLLSFSLITGALRLVDTSSRCVRYLLFVEFFYIQILGYHCKNLILSEFFFLPLVITDIAIMFPIKAALPLEIVCGLILAPFMGYTFQAHAKLTVSSLEIPLHAIAFLFYAVCVYACSLLSLIIHKQCQMQAAHDAEFTVNRNLDSINRVLSSEMFTIRSESELQAKKEVTQEIHDNVGYIFTNLIMMLQATEAVFEREPDRARAMLSNCVEYGRQGMNSIRETLRSVRHKEEHSELPIKNELHALACLFSRCTGTVVRTEFGNWPRNFTPAIDSFLLSFVKESLTNAIKHGMATDIQITCILLRQKISITVQDNGIGVSDEAIHYGIGLQSIAENAAQLGGNMKVISREKGFGIRVQLPVSNSADLR